MSSSEMKRKIEELDSISELNDDGDLTNDSSLSSMSSFAVKSSMKKSTSSSGLVTESSSSNTNEYLRKITKIIETHFDEEINYKKYELDKICDRIFEAQSMLDKLRVCVICNYYSLNGKLNLNEYIDHPVISSLKCEHLEMAIQQGLSEKMSMVNEVLAKQQTNRSNSIDSSVQLHNLKRCEDEESSMNKLHQLERQIIMENYQQFNVKLFVGNVSKSLNTSTSNAASRTEQILLLNEQGETVIESSQYNQELITHKWMIYIRSPNCAKLSNYIRKVIFYLHFSYKPYDVVEVRNAPFQLIRRGWGEFPVHVQIHFKDPRNKRVDINHQLKLDWTQTGLQTFGGETSQDVCMYIKRNDFISANQTNSNLAATTTTTSTSTTSHEPENTGINEQTNLNETEQERFDYYTQPQIDQQIDQQQDQLSQSLQEEYTFNAQSERRVEEESEYRNGENFINTVFDSDSSSSFGVTSILMPTNSIQSDTNTFDGRMSPSNFISTDVQHEKEQQQSIQNNQVRPEQLEARTNSIGFDELMRNICSNANVSNQTVTQTANTIAESAIIKLKPNDVTNNNATTTRIETSKLKTNLDDLLNLRPKSLSSGPQSKLPLTLIKSVLPIKTVSHSSMSTAALPITQNAHSIQLNKTHESRIVSENYLDDKKVVIYKVDSSDLSNKTSSSILNLSTNKHTNAHVLTNYSSFNHNIDCGVSELMHRKSALPSAQFDNNCEQTLTPLATTSTKKIKLTSDQLTKIKRVEQQSQIDFNHHQESKTAFNHSNQSEPMNLMKNENEDHLLMREAIANEQQIEFQEAPLVNMFDEQQKYIYTVERLIEQLKISNQNDELQNKLFNFEYFLRIAHKYCPIVCHKPTDERHKAIKSAKVNYLFCANSIHEFYTWPYAKRKANEWLRALYIKRKCQQLISFHKSNVNIELWSTKAIVLWLRSHGFTPLEYKHMFANQHQYNQYSSQEHLELNRYVNSFSSVNELIKLDKHEQNLSEGLRQKKSNHEEDDDENIDIVNNYEEKAKPKNYLIKKMEYLAEEQHTETCEVDSIEMCLGSKFVREQLDLLDFKTKQVYVVPSLETTESAENLFSCHLVERFLFAVWKRFAEDLIRETCSNIYHGISQNDSSAHRQSKSSKLAQSRKPTRSNETSKKDTRECHKQQQPEWPLDTQRFPLYLGVRDIYNTIVHKEKYDFLTNKYMSLDRSVREKTEK